METSNKRNTYNKKTAENDFQRALRLAEEFKGLTTNDQIHKRSHGEINSRISPRSKYLIEIYQFN